MSRILYRWGRAAARHPWRMIGLWLVVAVAVLGLEASVGGETSDDWSFPGTEAQLGADVLEQSFPTEGGVAGRVVFADPDGDITDAKARAAIESTLAEMKAGPNVLAVTDPFDPAQPAVSPDGRVAFATVRYSIDPPGPAEGEAALDAVEIARQAGLQAELSREVLRGVEEVEGKEAIGLAIAVVVLLVAFGSVIAAGIPIGSAIFGIFVGLGLVTVMAGFTDVPSVSPLIATMIGIGVGIDYALFVVTRHRGFLAEGKDPVESAALANATAGTAVLFAGSTVVIALIGLVLAGIPSIATMGYASAITVAVAMAGAVTLLPAFLGLAGHRIDRWKIGRRVRTGESAKAAHHTLAGRWADHVGRHPWRYAIGSFVVLVAVAAPVLDMRTGLTDDGVAGTEHTYRQAYDLLAAGFGPGFNGPFTIAVDSHDDAQLDAGQLAALQSAVAGTEGVAFTTAPVVSPSGTTAVITAFPTTGPSDAATEELVHTLRDEVIPRAMGEGGVDTYVTGQTAAFIDISEKLASRLPIFIVAVVGLSFLLLMLVFRSVLVPLKAAVMNLLSIGAAYGVVVAVFQWGWGNELIGVSDTVPVSPFLPMIMFAILFGLSMDYEVFLLSRVREEFVRTGDSHRSVVDGLASTARVISSAALIMISVFAAFLLTPDVEVKMFAVGLTVAVLVDATIVRMILVPATMALMGDANWWLPGWLDRILPHVDVEGSSVLGHLADEPAITIPDDLSELDEEVVHT
ncbi:MAG TPA: MMPL family transporter [Ilumatobacter sp.]|nr:MMPL family transporter [Ilumatobacter sp.]